ncbi:MAG: hypothetical protein ACR2LF_09275 [Jatrophihabitantaceae bacterium]
MKLSFLAAGAVGYVLGAKAGRERYETIVRLGRQIAGSQTVQATAGVLQGQVDTVAHRARQALAGKLHPAAGQGANGYHG